MKKVLTIILGYNYDTLLGSENDAILIYNIFYRFYLNNNIYWNKPLLLKNNNVKMDKVINYIKKNINNFSILLIYFSGHSSKKNIFFYKSKLSRNNFFCKINMVLNKNIDFFLILDSCYSELFMKLDSKYNKIKKKYFILSSKKNQKSAEGFINYNDKYFEYKKAKVNNDKIILGIFTYNFCKLLYKMNEINDVSKILEIKRSPLWKQIEKICNQQIQIKILN